MRNITMIVYGVMVGYFIRMAIKKVMLRCAGVEITFDYPVGNGEYPQPYLCSNGKWKIEKGLMEAMRNDGLQFDHKTGRWLKDPSYVEPELSMPF